LGFLEKSKEPDKHVGLVKIKNRERKMTNNGTKKTLSGSNLKLPTNMLKPECLVEVVCFLESHALVC
jgi:hypothetical protein